MTYGSVEEANAALRDLLVAAEAANVPWSYQLSDRALSDPEYQRWLAHVYVCRAIGVDALSPPEILGPVPPRPAVNQRELERDLDALGDFSIRPLHDFARSRQAPE